LLIFALFLILVQTPAPVKNLNVSSSDYSARVTWEIPTPQDSSYITHYLIFLNDKFVKEISRAMYGTEFNILPLKPNTENTFGIQTKDGSVQRGTYVNETFTTKQAGKDRRYYKKVTYLPLKLSPHSLNSLFLENIY
jgi:hypothetical protein